ncbi:MAG TPA: DUF1549 and DUF1553 domain-containing protein [Gemmataceae bacterium]
MIRRFRVRPRHCSIHFLTAVFLLGLLAVPGRGAESERPEWPFTPLKRPAVPQVRNKGWVRNPLDAFVLAGLEKVGLRPNPPADKLTLLRRVTFDLTGLMPTPAERDAFLADAAPDAYERLVDRLLRSPRFGERWAQHWLDLVRYAESEGFKLDKIRPEAYRYRDYVIRAFNADLPYDRFLSQQLAGDELEPNNPDALVATGFYRLHPEESNGSNYCLIRQDILDDITDVFGTTFLGLTVGCARCHDHKFDPITQRDYYRLQAFFTPMMERDDLPLASAEEQADYRRRLAKWEEATRELRTKRDAMEAGPRKAVFGDVLPTFDRETQKALTTPAEKRTSLQRQLAQLAGKQVDRRCARAYRRLPKEQRAIYDELKQKIAAFDSIKPEELPMGWGVADLDSAPATYRLATGNYLKPKERVQPGSPGCFEKKVSGTALRREALARWLCEPDNPLTGRVIVNRLWQHHLGAGIVATPNDFGAQGEKPTHPELLDYLATELVRQGWKLKALHRLIVTSATYRQASSPTRNATAEKAAEADPDNKLLWHARVKRREGEAIRDAVLQASGQLDLRMYGPSNYPELPAAFEENDYMWKPDKRAADRNRRSIYMLARRNLALPLFAAFDLPDRVNSCPVRAATITSPQALAMLNGEFTLAQARLLAGDLLAAHGHANEKLIRAAYQRAFGREPERDEVAAAEKFLRSQARRIASDGEPSRDALASAVVDFCHALLNAAEFLDVE